MRSKCMSVFEDLRMLCFRPLVIRFQDLLSKDSSKPSCNVSYAQGIILSLGSVLAMVVLLWGS